MNELQIKQDTKVYGVISIEELRELVKAVQSKALEPASYLVFHCRVSKVKGTLQMGFLHPSYGFPDDGYYNAYGVLLQKKLEDLLSEALASVSRRVNFFEGRDVRCVVFDAVVTPWEGRLQIQNVQLRK